MAPSMQGGAGLAEGRGAVRSAPRKRWMQAAGSTCRQQEACTPHPYTPAARACLGTWRRCKLGSTGTARGPPGPGHVRTSPAATPGHVPPQPALPVPACAGTPPVDDAPAPWEVPPLAAFSPLHTSLPLAPSPPWPGPRQLCLAAAGAGMSAMIVPVSDCNSSFPRSTTRPCPGT